MFALQAIFGIIPGWIYAIIIGVLVAFSGTNYVRMEHAQSALEEYKLEVAQNTQKAESAARAKEEEMNKQNEKVTQDAQKRETVLISRINSANTAVVGLRDEITRLNARTAPTDSVSLAYFNEARTARELLGACTKEYQSVAKDADGFRDQIIGLQDYISRVK